MEKYGKIMKNTQIGFGQFRKSLRVFSETQGIQILARSFSGTRGTAVSARYCLGVSMGILCSGKVYQSTPICIVAFQGSKLYAGSLQHFYAEISDLNRIQTLLVMGFVNSIAAMCRGYVPWLIDHLEYKATSAIDHVIQVSPTGPARPWFQCC
jgi:hypothetical protein